jgi:nitrate reductase gamma subunit
MDLLHLARGPLLQIALFILFAGSAWRLIALWRRSPARDLSQPKHENVLGAALRTLVVRTLPRGGLHPSSTLVTVNPYVFHVGLAVIAFGYAPHIDFIGRLTGLHWPSLPDAVIYIAAGLTIPSLLLALLFRLTDPTLRLISSFDDYAVWVVTFLPLITGMAVVMGPSTAATLVHDPVYPVPLAIHLLSVELLLVWFPFSKLMHALLVIPGRMQFGAMLARRGVKA